MSLSASREPDLIAWSEWYPLFGSSRNLRIPGSSGLYRVRLADSGEIVYIGQTGRSLRERLGMLCTCYREEMPYRDPHTAAPTLWALRHRDGVEFEVSVAPLEVTKVERLGLEAVAISLQRVVDGRSPLANFSGRIAGYRLSSANNSALVAAGNRYIGGPDPSVAASVSLPVPGPLDGEVVASSWLGLDWSEWSPIDHFIDAGAAGLYRIRRKEQGRLLYVGQGKIAGRVRAHRSKSAIKGHRQGVHFAGELEVSWVALDAEVRGLLEIENDAIASHYLMLGAPPIAQFLG